jgi:hypothetical protein
MGFCRAFFADHFAKKSFPVCVTNNKTKVKIGKNMLRLSVGIGWSFRYFDPSTFIYRSNFSLFLAKWSAKKALQSSIAKNLFRELLFFR